MTRKIFCLLLTALVIGPLQTCPVFGEEFDPAKKIEDNKAASTSEPSLVTDIRALEFQILGSSPENKSIDERLVGLELKLFGQKSSVSLFERLAKIRSASTASSATITPSAASATSAATAPSTESQSSVPEVVGEATSAPLDIAIPGAATIGGSKKGSTVPASPKVAQLLAARALFEDKNYKGARKLVEAFIAKNPMIYNGYYLLGLIDLKEHDALPEYDQFAFDQILKALYLAPQSQDCYTVFSYVMSLERVLHYKDPRFAAVSSYPNGSPRALLCVGVNCFLRDDDANAKDLFDFTLKYSPGGAASANYNLGAMAEKRGQMQSAIAFYRAALIACNDRNALYKARLLKMNDVDSLSVNLIRRTMQRVEIKIKAADKTWTGPEQVKGTTLTSRCTINRLTEDDMGDVRDAGEFLPQ